MPYVDLCVPRGARVSLQELRRCGYGVVCVGVESESGAKPKDAAAVELLAETLQSKSGRYRKAAVYTPNVANALRVSGEQETPRQLRRVTLKLDDVASAQMMLATPAVKSYDVVAAEAQTAKAFQFLCEHADVDVITFDITNRIPFAIKRAWINAAIKRSVYFEITYTPCLGDSAGRRYFFSNASNLVRLTGGRNLVLSSGATRDILLRSPYDVVNVGLLVGLTYAQAMDAISSSCMAVLAHAETRRGKSAVAVSVQPADVSMEG